MFVRVSRISRLWFAALLLTAVPAKAALFSFTASGTISSNSSADSSISLGTPWTFQLIYDTAAPDLDFELTTDPDPSFGRYTNTGAVAALTYFHYQAGSYEVTISNPADFGTGSNILITFGGATAIDINVNASGFFPALAGGAVSFHADFNDFVSGGLTSDALPTNTALGLPNFPSGSTISLLPANGGAISGSPSDLAIASVPEPASGALVVVGFVALLVAGRFVRSA